jgi:hypothetical protein
MSILCRPPMMGQQIPNHRLAKGNYAIEVQPRSITIKPNLMVVDNNASLRKLAHRGIPHNLKL